MLPDPRPYCTDLCDPRRETRNKRLQLNAIILLVFCAVLSGIEDGVGRAELAEHKAGGFRGFLDLANGLPSPDTLGDVFGRLNPEAWVEALVPWVQVALPRLADAQVCLDAKSRRGSRVGERAVHLLSAYAAKARLVLAQPGVADQANELPALAELLSLLDVQGAGVTIEAMGCPKALTQRLVEAGADYGLALKDHHPTLHEDVRVGLETDTAQARLPQSETGEKGHGRLESRRYALSAQIAWRAPNAEWSGLQAVGRVEATRLSGGKTPTDSR